MDKMKNCVCSLVFDIVSYDSSHRLGLKISLSSKRKWGILLKSVLIKG